MQCNCGSSTTYYAHEVKTIEKAQEWYPEAIESDLPIIVRRDECQSCGRYFLLPLRK